MSAFMNFSLRQWVFSFFLDASIKALLAVFLGLAVTLGAAPVSGFIFIATLFSMLHFLCLFLASLSLNLLEQRGLKPSGAAKFAFVLIVANSLFVVGYAAFFGLGHRPDEVLPGFGSQAIFGCLIAVTNILPILIVAACGRFFFGSTSR